MYIIFKADIKILNFNRPLISISMNILLKNKSFLIFENFWNSIFLKLDLDFSSGQWTNDFGFLNFKKFHFTRLSIINLLKNKWFKLYYSIGNITICWLMMNSKLNNLRKVMRNKILLYCNIIFYFNSVVIISINFRRIRC